MDTYCASDDDDPIFERIKASVGPCTIGRENQTLFAYLCGCILGQRIRFSKARAMRSRLYTETGARSFTPDQLLALDDDAWERIGCGSVLRDRLRALARDPDNWKYAKGVGPWTRDAVKIQYGLDDDLFLAQDKHVQRVLREQYGVKSDFAEFARKKWAPNRSYYCWYLWKYGT